MASYSFKRETKLYVVYGGLQYNIDMSEINFSQTVTEESYDDKTIHSQNLFESSNILKANPANFDFVIPAIREDDFEVVFDRALDCASFDLYISTQQDVFKIETCVITSLVFITDRGSPLGFSISGEASRLSRLGDFGVATIPGSVQARDSNMTYNLCKNMVITLDGAVNLASDVVSITTELQNQISWVPNTVVTGVCAAPDTVSYPSTYVIDKKILAGTITRYLTDTNNTELQEWNTDTTLYMELGQDVGGTIYGFTFDISNCSFTNRLGVSEVYIQSYDWRMTQNPTSLSDVLTYVTL